VSTVLIFIFIIIIIIIVIVIIIIVIIIIVIVIIVVIIIVILGSWRSRALVTMRKLLPTYVRELIVTELERGLSARSPLIVSANQLVMMLEYFHSPTLLLVGQLQARLRLVVGERLVK
jgi:Flp pilus assembly protein TadB